MIDLSMDGANDAIANRRKAAAQSPPILTPEIRAQLNKEIKGIEEAAFEKGKAAAQRERTGPAEGGMAAKLAKRAAELQAAALANGAPLKNSAAVKRAYEEAGIPLE